MAFYVRLMGLSMVLLLARCDYNAGVHGSGNVVREQRSVPAFHSVEARGRFDLRLKEGPQEALRLSGEDNILPLLDTRVEKGVLILESRERLGRIKTVEVQLTAPLFRRLVISGAGELSSENTWHSDSLWLVVQGAADIEADVVATYLSTEISGAGEANLRGSAQRFEFSASGAGELQAFDLRTANSSVSISGAGSAEVNASDRLDAQISGAGSVRYKGNPSQVNKSVSGAGSIRAVADTSATP